MGVLSRILVPMSKVATIVQLTDLHLTSKEGRRAWRSDVWSNLDRVLAHIGKMSPDLVVLTGDIANVGNPQTYARLRERLTPWLNQLRLVPGNHDNRAMLRFEFEDRLQGDAHNANFRLELAGFDIIGLDSHRRGRVHGRLGEDQLRWLKGELDGRQRPTLLFQHHPSVLVDCWWLDRDRLRDHDRLRDIIADSSVRAIFCGHVHQEHHGLFAGIDLWTSPSTAYQFKPKTRWPGKVESRSPAYRVIELEGGELRTRVVRL